MSEKERPYSYTAGETMQILARHANAHDFDPSQDYLVCDLLHRNHIEPARYECHVEQDYAHVGMMLPDSQIVNAFRLGRYSGQDLQSPGETISIYDDLEP